MSNPTTLSLSDANQRLQQWGCCRNPPDVASYSDIRNALATVVAHSDNQILGICAGSLAEGQQALIAYTRALGYAVDVGKLQAPDQDATTPCSVYIKYNPRSGLLYASDYEGTHRGVLVSCQSDTDSGLNEMYGHLPLDLFSEP